MTCQARQVFIAGTGLPGRWSGCSDFTIVETAFGPGHNFIATWQTWREDLRRSTRLHYVAVGAGALSRLDLQRAHAATAEALLVQQLADQWPTAVNGLHRLVFEQGAVQLLLAFGDPRRLLPDLLFEADAFYLSAPGSADGSPAAPGTGTAARPDATDGGGVSAPCAAISDQRVIRALSRHARPGATLAAPCVAPDLIDRLTAAGFECRRNVETDSEGGAGACLQARHAPRHTVRRSTPPPPAADTRQAVVVGAGLAGACVAASLAEQGFEVLVLDRHASPAWGSSGNPAGLFHATVHGDDSPYARLFRAAALHTARLLRNLPAQQVPHAQSGLLRLEHQLTPDAMQALIARQRLPPGFVQALDADEATQRSGVPLSAPAWFYPEGGWVAPAALVRQRLARPGVRFIGGARVQAIQRHGQCWTCLDDRGTVLASAPHLVLANAEQANPLLASIGWPGFPWHRSVGQVSLYQAAGDAPGLRLPVAGAGYAVPLPDGWLLCGATTRPDSDDATPLLEDHRANFSRLQAMCGLHPPDDVVRWQGRVGWRVQPSDRLPVAGPLAVREPVATARLDQARLVPREPGLHIACGFGARGITLAPLLGDVVAARISGTPVPLEQGLVDLIDPARWVVRAARRRAGGR